MANDYTNYDMLDKMIANHRKAKSWTLFWVVALCVLAGAVMWMAFDIADKKNTIITQRNELDNQQQFLIVKDKLIDSLRENCNSEKTAIVQTCDSIIGETQEAISSLIKPTQGVTAATVGISANQKARLVQANSSLKKVQGDLYDIKKVIKKEQPKIFIQYNNRSDIDAINSLISTLKKSGQYYVAPAEYINSNFPTVIKLYNHAATADEKEMMAAVARQFDINASGIKVQHLKSSKVKDVIEIWIDNN